MKKCKCGTLYNGKDNVCYGCRQVYNSKAYKKRVENKKSKYRDNKWESERDKFLDFYNKGSYFARDILFDSGHSVIK